jgi:hypothetical protein
MKSTVPERLLTLALFAVIAMPVIVASCAVQVGQVGHAVENAVFGAAERREWREWRRYIRAACTRGASHA